MNTDPTDPIRPSDDDAAAGRTTPTSPSSDRETEELQRDQEHSPVFDDPDIDQSAITLLPGTGDYTDDGDVEVDPADIHLPHLPGRSDARPPVD